MNETIDENNNTYRDDNDIHIHDVDNLEEIKIVEKNNDINITKNILLYRNGDKFFPPKRFVVNKRYIRTWDSFLEQLTNSIQPRNGAIRDIRTPFHGTRIRSLDDLMINGKYVAVSKGETMKLIDYTTVVDVTSPLHQTKKESQRLKPLRPINHDMEKIESRVTQQLYTKGIAIRIYRNGDPFTRAIKVVLNHVEQKHMSILVRAIEERVLLPSNRPIRRLYTLNGEIIRFAKDVENGQYYVAASNEPFYDIKYGQYLPVLRGGKVASSRHKIKYLNHSPTPVTNRNNIDGNHNHETTYRPQKSGYETDRYKHPPMTTRNQKKTTKEYSEKEAAAIKIQAAFRGYSTRMEIQNAEKNNKPMSQTRYHYDPNKFRPKKEDHHAKEKFYKKPLTERLEIKRDDNNHSKEPQNSKEKTKINKEKVSDNKGNRQPNVAIKEREKKKKPNTIHQSNEEYLAAVKIQAGFRGYLARKQMTEYKYLSKPEDKTISKAPEHKTIKHTQEKEKKNINQNKSEKKDQQKNDKKDESNVEKETAALKIQGGFRAYKTRKNIDENEENKRKEKASIIIQSGFRAYKTRKNIKEKEETQRKEKASIIIQSGFRAYRNRKYLKENGSIRKNENEDTQRKEKAAQTIQAGFRAYKTRTLLNEKDKIQRREAAAIVIQSGYKGLISRQAINDKINKDMKEKAALKIQGSYRGFQTRKTISNDLNARLLEKSAEEQASERNNSVMKIQASFRGYKARKNAER